jgi:hypothetical protein
VAATAALLVAVDVAAVADLGGLDVVLAHHGGGLVRTLALGLVLLVAGGGGGGQGRVMGWPVWKSRLPV